MFHVRKLIAVVALACLAGHAQAQQPAQGQQPAQPAQAKQTTPKTPAHLEAARTVVLASGIARSFDNMLPGFLQQVRRITVTRPDLTKDLEEVITKVSPEFDKTKQELIDAAARTYANYLTEAELKEVGAFFNSPTGKRYVDTQPLIISEMYAEVESWSQRTSASLVERIRTEMRARGKQF
jgi:uncharacterized protein